MTEINKNLFVHQEIAEALIPVNGFAGSDIAQGVVQSIDWSTYTIGVQIEGSTVTVSGVKFLPTFMPVIGNNVWLNRVAKNSFLAIGSSQISNPQTYTSTLGVWTLGNGTVTSNYYRVGSKCDFDLVFVFGSTSVFTASEPTFSLPFAPNAFTTESNLRQYMNCTLTDNSGAGLILGAVYGLSGSTVKAMFITDIAYPPTAGSPHKFGNLIANNNPIIWTTSDAIRIGGYFFC